VTKDQKYQRTGRYSV